MTETNWYVVHTYSGYENKVKANIEKTIENRKLQDQILEVRVPLQDVTELKNGVKKTGFQEDVPRIRADPHGDERRHMVCCQKHQRCDRIRRPWFQTGPIDTG